MAFLELPGLRSYPEVKGHNGFFLKLPKEISGCFTASRLNAAYVRVSCSGMEK